MVHQEDVIYCSHCREEAQSCVCDGGIGSPFYTDGELKDMRTNHILNLGDLDAMHDALDQGNADRLSCQDVYWEIMNAKVDMPNLYRALAKNALDNGNLNMLTGIKEKLGIGNETTS